MRFRSLVASVLLACVMGVGPAVAWSADGVTCPERKKPGKPPDCSDCKDLPKLYRELLEQEFLRNLFKSWVDQSYYPATVDTMQKYAAKQLGVAMKGNLYGVLAPQGGGGQGGGAAPAYGTDLTSKDCRLVEYLTCKKNAGQANEEEVQKQVPVTPDDVRARNCKPIADYVLAHEGRHQEQCRKQWQETKSDKFITVEYVAQDDYAAYEKGIAVLRDYIAKLAKDCGWSGSTNERKSDGTMTVPTPEEIQQLKDNTRAKASKLRRRSK